MGSRETTALPMSSGVIWKEKLSKIKMKEKTEQYCPMYVDYVRECMDYIRIVSKVCTMKFCIGEEKYDNCPFYRTVNKIGCVCEMVSICPIYKEFSYKNFDKFMVFTKNYCLSENNINCERLKIKKAGNAPPIDLLPDGTKFEK